MRSGLLVALLAAISLTGGVVAGAQNGPASHQAVMPMTVNGVSKGDASIIIEGGDVLLRVPDLEAAGVRGLAGDRRTVGGESFVSLRSLAALVAWTIDEANLRLLLTVEPSVFDRSELSLASKRPEGILYSKSTSAFLNYSASLNDSGDATGFAEAGWSMRGSLLYSGVARTEAGSFVRGQTNLVVDDRSRLMRWTFGDSVAGLAGLTSGPFIGGVSVSRQFSLDPYFYYLPGVDMSGTALTPSRADVYVNGQLVRQVQLQPGAFDLRSIPVNAGSGDVQVVVRDAFGGERTISSPYYLTSQLLAPGLSEFSYNLGFRREDVATQSLDYGGPVFLGAHRLGLSTRLTAGLRAEAARDLMSGGGSARANYGFGDIEIVAGASRSSGLNGWTASLAYAYMGRGVNASLYYRRTSDSYVTTTLAAAASRLTSDANAVIGVSLRRVALSLEYGISEDRDRGAGNRASARVSTNLGSRLRLHVSAGRSRTEGKPYVTGVQANLICVLGSMRSAVVSWNRGENTSTGSADLVQSLPRGVGLGYRLHSTVEDSQLTGSGLAQYQGPAGLYEAYYSRTGESGSGYASISGGLAAIGGGLHVTRAVRDGFALIRTPHLAGIRAYASNQQVGTTDSSGDAFVPDLIPYYGNQLSIADQDVPMDYEVEGVHKLVAPPYRGGALVDFPVRKYQAFHGPVTLSFRGKDVVPTYGAVHLSEGGRDFDSPIGAKGEYYIENVPAGTHRLDILYLGTACQVSVTFPTARESVVQMPALRCSVDAPSPVAARPEAPAPVESQPSVPPTLTTGPLNPPMPPGTVPHPSEGVP